MTLLTIYTLTAGFFLCIFLLTAVSNLFFFPKLNHSGPNLKPVEGVEERLSILIPARNEAAVIDRTVRQLLAQTTAEFELILLDDNSTDGTAEIAARAAAGDPRFRLIHGRPLPADWLGKNWACHQLSRAAHGRLLLFTDADVQWTPDALESLLRHRAETAADLLTIWPTQHTPTWPERLVIPLMKFAIVAYLPLIGVHHTPFTAFAAANGQCLLFRREAYEAGGGHTAVRRAIIEDVELAKAIKRHGYRLRMADGAQKISCRMYDGWTAVRDGFGKNILAGHGRSVPFLLLSTVFHWALFVVPALLLFVPATQLVGMGLLGLGGLLRLLVGVYTGEPLGPAVVNAVLMPLSVLLMTRIAAHAIHWHTTGGPRWKGRTLPP